jgi:recombination protein RecR
MNVFPPALERLIESLNKLPGIGKKTATRLALYFLRKSEAEAISLAQNLTQLHKLIQLCSCCFSFSENDPCDICNDPKRDSSIICIIEEPGDLAAIEKTNSFHGKYHILHGVLSPMDGIGPAEIKIGALLSRLSKENIKEVILATSSTVPGEATAAYLFEQLQKFPIKTTRLARGIPMGMDIKYADEITLGKAIEARK